MTIHRQILRIQKVYEQLGYRFCSQPPASEEAIRDLEHKSGIKLDPDLAALWRYSNGSDMQGWFLDHYSEPFRLMTVEESLENWTHFLAAGERGSALVQ